MKKTITIIAIGVAMTASAQTQTKDANKLKVEMTAEHWQYHLGSLNNLKNLSQKYSETISVADAMKINSIVDSLTTVAIQQLQKQVKP